MDKTDNRKLITFTKVGFCGLYAINIADFCEKAYSKLKPLIESVRNADKSVDLDTKEWNSFFKRLDAISSTCREKAVKDDLAYFNEWVIRQFGICHFDDEKDFCYLDGEDVSYHKNILEEDNSVYLMGNEIAAKRAREEADDND